MRQHSLELAEGGIKKNIGVEFGTAFPDNANDGELFFRTDLRLLYSCEDYTIPRWEPIGSNLEPKNYPIEFSETITVGDPIKIINNAGPKAEKAFAITDLIGGTLTTLNSGSYDENAGIGYLGNNFYIFAQIESGIMYYAIAEYIDFDSELTIHTTNQVITGQAATAWGTKFTPPRASDNRIGILGGGPSGFTQQFSTGVWNEGSKTVTWDGNQVLTFSSFALCGEIIYDIDHDVWIGLSNYQGFDIGVYIWSVTTGGVVTEEYVDYNISTAGTYNVTGSIPNIGLVKISTDRFAIFSPSHNGVLIFELDGSHDIVANSGWVALGDSLVTHTGSLRWDSSNNVLLLVGKDFADSNNVFVASYTVSGITPTYETYAKETWNGGNTTTLFGTLQSVWNTIANEGYVSTRASKTSPIYAAKFTYASGTPIIHGPEKWIADTISGQNNQNGAPLCYNHDSNVLTWAFLKSTSYNSVSSQLITVTSYIAEFTGIAQESGVLGETKDVALLGRGISRVHSALIPGSMYYLQTDGSITTNENVFPIGYARSTTEIVLTGNEFGQNEIQIQASQVVDFDGAVGISTHATTNNIHIDWTSDQGTTNINDNNIPHIGVVSGNPHSVNIMNVWNTIIKNEAYQAVAGDEILADTASIGTFIISLPVTPNIGDKVRIIDSTGNFTVASCFVNPGVNYGIKGDTVDVDLELDLSGTVIELIFVNATYGWNYILYA